MKSSPRTHGRIHTKKGRTTAKRWSRHVTETSHALELAPHVFKGDDAGSIARSLKRSAERSRARKAGAYRSAMSMLTFYVNRGGKKLSPSRRHTFERAKTELRRLFGRPNRP